MKSTWTSNVLSEAFQIDLPDVLDRLRHCHNAYSFVVSRGSSASRAPKLSLILSLIGMDGYLSNAGLSTFYILGEWFLGFIVFFYIVFPLLRYGVLHHPWITAGLGLAAYAATLLLHPHLGQMPENLLLTTRIPELCFGMYFVRYVNTVSHPVALIAAVLLVFQAFTGQIPGSFAVTVVAWPPSFCWSGSAAGLNTAP